MKKPFLTIFLAICTVICLGRVVLLSIDFTSHSLQMDFSAFYTAGESVNNGYSPYKNNINENPSVWDGKSQFIFSRFLYPPLTATFFRGLALLPYSFAKFIWVIFILACLVASFFIFLRIFREGKTFEVNWFGVLILTCLFPPLLSFIERGQIDSVTLLVFCLGFYVMLNKTNNKGLYAGLLFALATLLKLNCIFLVPFFLLRKRFDVLLGYIVGGILLILASVVFNGFDFTAHYITTDFPRISTYGEGIYSEDILLASDRYPSGGGGLYSVKQGVVYNLSLVDFDGTPNLVQPFEGLFSQSPTAPSMSVVSLLIFGIIFASVTIREIYLIKVKKAYEVHDEFLFWQLVLLIILLASPTTWVMNLVWLCPLIFYVLYYYKNRTGLNKSSSFYLIITGLLFVALPDRVSFPFTLFSSSSNLITNILVNYLWANKYQIGEIILGLFFLVEYIKPVKNLVHLEGNAETKDNEEKLTGSELSQHVPTNPLIGSTISTTLGNSSKG